jgi:hypothetical protein
MSSSWKIELLLIAKVGGFCNYLTYEKKKKKKG